MKMYEDILQDVESKEVIALGSGGIYGVLPVKDRSGPNWKANTAVYTVRAKSSKFKPEAQLCNTS